jgi:hypothetical protein
VADITPPAPIGSGLDLRARLRLIQVRTPAQHGFALIALSGTTHRLHCLAAEADEIRGVAGVPVDNIPESPHLVEEAATRIALPGGQRSSRVVSNPLRWFSDHRSPLSRIVGSALPDGIPTEIAGDILASYETLIGREIEQIGQRLSPSAFDAAKAMSEAVEFNWRAVALVSEDSPLGDALRRFAAANPALAGVVPIADGIMLGAEAHVKGPVSKAVRADETPSAIARSMAGKTGRLALAAHRPRFEPAAFDRLENVPLFGTNSEKLDVIACAGTMHPAWVPRDMASMQSLMDVLACLRAALGKRIHPTTPEQANALFAGAKGDWASVIAKAVSAAGLSRDADAKALAAVLGDWRRARAEFVDDVLIPATLLHGCPVIAETANLEPVYREGRLDALADGLLTRGMTLPALSAQALRHREGTKTILAARAAFPLPRRAAGDGDGMSHRLRYDAHAPGALEAVLDAWRPILPRSLRKLDPTKILSGEVHLWNARLLGMRAGLAERVGLPRAA